MLYKVIYKADTINYIVKIELLKLINMTKQPWGITLNCFVLAISGVLAFFAALALLIAGTIATTSIAILTGVGVTNIAGYITMGGAFLIILSVVSFALCYLLWKRNDVAWWITLILLVLGICADVSAILLFGYTIAAMTFIAIGVNILLILGLLHRETISACKPDIAWPGWILED